MQLLSSTEIGLVCGSAGYRAESGTSFTWTGPNGQRFDNVVYVGTHYFEFADGAQEWYSDIFHRPSMPLPDLESFVNSLGASGVPIHVYYA